MAVMMVMPTMLVMVMMMAVVVSVLMTGMVMGFDGSVRMALAAVGAAFRIERCLDLDQPRPQTAHHRFDDVVAPDSQATACDLRRQVTVAKMPGDANQMLRIVAANFDQRLRRRDDLYQPAVLEHQRVAAA